MKLATTALPLLFLFACSAAPVDDGATDEDESSAALQSACTLGKDCGDVKLLKARAYASGRPPAVRRSDVTVDLGAGQDARVFARATSRTFNFDGTKKITLSGDAAGTAGIHVDDFLLVEVLSTTGELLAAGAVNAGSVKVATIAAPALAPIPAHAGAGQGWIYDARAVDLTALLPKGTPFRLRLSAFDVAAESLVSDVFLTAEDAPAPPTPPTPPTPPAPVTNDDPFDPASCVGAPMTTADFVQHFAPGATVAYLGNYSVKSRTRDCNALTGCGAYRDNPYAFNMKVLNHDDQAPPNADPSQGALMLRARSGKILPSFENASCWGNSVTRDTCVAFDGESPSTSIGTTHYGWNCFQLNGAPDGSFRCGGYSYVSSLFYSGSQKGMKANVRTLAAFGFAPVMGDPSSNMPYAQASFTKHCARVYAWSTSTPGHSGGDHSETEVATLIRY